MSSLTIQNGSNNNTNPPVGGLGFLCNTTLVSHCQYCSFPNSCGLCANSYLLTFNQSTGTFYCQFTTPNTLDNCMVMYSSSNC